MTVPPSPHDEQQATNPPHPDESLATPVTIPIEKPETPGQAKRKRIAPKPPSSPIKKGLFLCVLGVILYTLFGFFITPRLITSLGANHLEKRLQRPVTIGSAQVNPFNFHIVLKNGIVGAEKNNPEDKVDPLFSFGRFKFKLNPQTIFTNKPVFQAIQGNSVFLHVLRNQDQSSNLQQLFQPTESSTPLDIQSFIGHLRQIDLEFTDTKLLFEDEHSKTTHTISQINFRLPGETSQGESPFFSASINGSPIEFGGFSGQTQTNEQSFQLHLKDINLPAYLNYLPVPFPTLINKGKADLDMTITTKPDNKKGFDIKLSGTGVARDIWMNDGKENHNKIDTVAFNFSSQLQDKKVIFHKLVLEQPELHLSHDQDGQFFFPAKESFSGAGAGNTIAIETIVIKKGKLVFIDQYIPGGFGVSFNDVNLSIDQNKDVNTVSYALNCVTNRKTRISSQGTITPDTWQIQGLFILQGLPLSPLNSYLTQPGTMTITSGLVEKLEASFTLSPQAVNKITNLENTLLSIKDLGLNADGKEIMAVPHINLVNSSYTQEKQIVNLGKVELLNGQFHLTPNTPFPIPAFVPGKKQLQWKTDHLRMENCMAHFRNFSLQKKPQTIAIPYFTGANISSNPQDIAVIEAKVKVLQKATWTPKGTVQFNPLRGSLHSTLSDLPLAHIPEPLLKWLKPPLLGGSLSAEGQFSFPKPVFTGSAAINGMKLRYGDQHDLLTVKQLQTGGTFSLMPLTVQIKQVRIKDLRTNISIARKQLLRSSDFFAREAAPSSTTQPTVSIQDITFSQSSFTLVDHTTDPSFAYTISQANGAIDHIDSTGTTVTKLNLEGLGTDQSRFHVSGTSHFFNETFGADLNVAIHDFPLAELRPFIEPITGYGLQGGMFNLNITYHEEQGVMTSDTMLDLRHLTLSNEEKGNSHFPDIVALLTDSNNHIQLDLPVNGDATDPSYTFQSAYGKKLGEFLLATMVSPFSALGDYYNEGQQPPSQIIFIPGTSIIAPEQQETLLSLQTIIKNRPLLHITLTGYSGSTDDREILLQEKQVAEQKRNQAKAIEAAGTAVAANYGEELITPKQGEVPPVLPAKTATLTKQELQDLATRRSTQIKTILMEQYAINGDILHIDATPTIVPQSDPGVEGHRVEFTLSGQLP